MTIPSKLEKMADLEIRQSINNLIIDNPDGSVIVFGKWRIMRIDKDVVVKENNTQHRFSSYRSALSWCIARKYKQLTLEINIKRLDNDRSRILDDIYCQRKLAQTSKSKDFKDIVLTKIQGQLGYLSGVEKDLYRYTSKAKYLQLQGFIK